jgi:hypothetical protein
MVEGLVEGNHDAEAGSSTFRRSRRASTQVEEQDDEEGDEDGDDVSGQFLNDNSNSKEEGDGVPDQPHVQDPGPILSIFRSETIRRP